MKKTFCLLAAIVLLSGLLASCGKASGKLRVVAEKESAGEKTVLSEDFFKDFDYTPVDSQAKALMEVASGTADACVVDYVCSIGMIGEGTDYEDLCVADRYSFAPEQYGIAFRKGSTKTAAMVNAAIAELIQNGRLEELAKKYKLEKQLLRQPAETPDEAALDSADWDYIRGKGKLVIGITYFQPMNYLENGKLTGFETEFASEVCKLLGLEPDFQEINWDSKEVELKAKSIDCIWNGMTINEDLLKNLQISAPYMSNRQVLVVRAEDAGKF